jgi:hypothetical protein
MTVIVVMALQVPGKSMSLIGSSQASPQSGKTRTGFWKAALADL